jgi:uncharacterized protein
MKQTLFHLAFPVHDLEEARRFYVEGLGCKQGRRSKHSLILELGGNQIVAQLTEVMPSPQKGIYPRHFGLIFRDEKEWERLLEVAREKKIKFYQEPKVRYSGTPLEHCTFFLEDPSHNLLEFKFYRQESAIFGEQDISQVGDSR